jgi:hypothetical protein
MPLRHACFISYRHGQRALAERIIGDLYEALSNELEVLVDAPDGPVAIDLDRLKGGMFYNEALASALCQSACMVIVFTPIYFSTTHTYCAREYKAMESLENERLKLLGNALDKQNGLIIPVVFRGPETLPPDLKNRRQFYRFDQFLLSDPKLSENPRYALTIRDMAKYIAERFHALNALPADPCRLCDKFALPTEDGIRVWLERIAPGRQNFVLREGDH